MSEPLTIVVDGKPIGKARPRFGKGNVYTTPETEAYETHVGYVARREMRSRQPFKLPLVMRVMAYFEIPASWPEHQRQAALLGVVRHTRKPDFDNIAKVLADALNGIAYEDDKQIVRFEIEKRYGPRAFAAVTVEEITGSYSEAQSQESLAS